MTIRVMKYSWPKHSQSPGQAQPEKLHATRTPPTASRRGHRDTTASPRFIADCSGLPGTCPGHSCSSWGPRALPGHMQALSTSGLGRKRAGGTPSAGAQLDTPALLFQMGSSWVWQGEQAGLDIPSSRRQLFYLTMIENLAVLGPSSPAPSGAQPESSCPLPGPSLSHFSDMK